MRRIQKVIQLICLVGICWGKASIAVETEEPIRFSEKHQVRHEKIPKACYLGRVYGALGAGLFLVAGTPLLLHQLGQPYTNGLPVYKFFGVVAGAVSLYMGYYNA